MGRLLVILALAVSAGCIDPDLVPCGANDCPTGSICQASSGRCVTPDELAQCADKPANAECVVGSVSGLCVDSACITASCGNGIVEPGEVCDDGNRTSGDGCSFDCLSLEVCGNGIVDFAVGEQCDDGNTVGDDACEANCQLPRCGDGIVNASVGEACDDGNRIDGDGCSRDCLSNETCGNGIRDPGEECDDGNHIDHDGCQSNCRIQRCGDGIVDPGETCDDGNFDNTDACLNTCVAAHCGDGFVWTGHEQCDDGNSDDTDLCPTTCKFAFCGDGFTYAGHEQCDDKNMDDVDCCHNDCTTPVCGDGVRECNEACDGGSSADTPNCRNRCTLACPGLGIDWENVDRSGVSGGHDSGTGTAFEYAMFGGQTYAYDLSPSPNRNIDIGLANLTDGSTTPDLQVASSGGFYFNSTTGVFEDDLNLCSAGDGTGSWTPGVLYTVTDVCGDSYSHLIVDDADSVTDTWPTCP